MARIKSGSHQFASQYGQELCEFFREAQIKYASGAVKPIVSEDGSSLITIQDGAWKYSDLWYGGEPYSGMTTIFRDGAACFSMVYAGRIMPYADLEVVTVGLMEALQQSDLHHPWRGPSKFITASGLQYSNKWSGGIRRFSGQERILSADGKETLYEASYMGGIVNKD